MYLHQKMHTYIIIEAAYGSHVVGMPVSIQRNYGFLYSGIPVSIFQNRGVKSPGILTMDGLTRKTLETTERYRDFKAAGTKGITGCDIRSSILPLLADHVLREANHYLRILKQEGE